MAFCGNCGQEIGAGAYCGGCGAPTGVHPSRMVLPGRAAGAAGPDASPSLGVGASGSPRPQPALLQARADLQALADKLLTYVRANRRRSAVLGSGLAVLLIVLGLLVFSGGGTSNGLASSYQCSGSGVSFTLTFSSTGDAGGYGLAGTVDRQGDEVSFSGGSIHNSGIDFGSVSDGNDPSAYFLQDGATLEGAGTVQMGMGETCTPS